MQPATAARKRAGQYGAEGDQRVLYSLLVWMMQYEIRPQGIQTSL